MESILKEHIVDHLDINNLIHNTEHGFMKKNSCLTNLLEALETQIYLDFAKAFDKVIRNQKCGKSEHFQKQAR